MAVKGFESANATEQHIKEENIAIWCVLQSANGSQNNGSYLESVLGVNVIMIHRQ
jgi:hypothetical protein